MIYLEYAATNPFIKYPCSKYGTFLNPNANYAYKEKRLLSEAENRVKKAIGAKSGKVVFGGTSSQLIENLMSAIDEKTNEYHVVCSVYEHDSFFKFRQSTVRDTVLLNGLLETYQDISECSDQLFVMWQGVNNLTGEVMPIVDIGNICHDWGACYICDMTAMIGHAPIPANIDNWCDCAVWSGHKLGTELSIGCCWVSDRLDKWLNGFKLHGTPNLAGALALTQAVEDACDSCKLGQNIIHYNELQNFMIGYFVGENVDFQLIPEYDEQPSGHEFTSAINAIRLPGFNADALQQYLASKQIYVSIGGSACAEKHDYRVLNAYGLSNDKASEVIRISFGKDSSVEEVKALVEGIKNFKELYVK